MKSGVAETGLSDYHSLIYTMLKTTFTKLEPKKYIYRCYKNFDDQNFLTELRTNLNN